MKPHPIEIRFADLDVMGHVNNAIYLNYFEQGRMAFFRQNANEQWDWRRSGIIVARNEVDYLKPLLLSDRAFVMAEMGKIGNKSFQMNMRVFKQTDEGEMDCVRGVVTLVCYDYEKGATIPVPDAWRAIAPK